MTSTEHHTTVLDATLARTWFDVLYVNTPGLVHVSSTGNWTGQTFADYDQAAAYVTHLDKAQPEGIYLRVTTLKGKPGTGGRGSAADSLALPGLWADIDIAGPGHKHDVCPADCQLKDRHVCVTRPLPPTEDAGRQIIAESGLPEPTLWVHSGGGLYPWWLLNEHIDITADNLANIKELSARWQTVIARSAAKLGYHYGPVGDLARILRIPGTVNRKEGLARPCRITDARPDRHSRGDIRAGLAAALKQHPDPQPTLAAPRRLEVVRPAGHITPNDDFEQRVEWDDQMLLGGAGWRVASGQPGAYCEWVRPGKTTAGISATTGKDPARDRLWVFSTDSGLPTEEPMTKPYVYALLNHGGDKKAATRELARLGYGTPLPPREKPAAPPPAAPRTIAPVDGTAARVIATSDDTIKRSIKLDGDADTIRQVQDAINNGALPDTYVTNGELVELTRVSGDSSAAGLAPAEQPPLPVISTPLSPDGLAALLAHHTYTHRIKKTRDGDLYEEEITPPARTLASVLSRRYWPGVPALHGIVGSPVLRPDGTLLQKPGYDPATGLYYAATVAVPHIPEQPGAELVDQARQFLLGDFLGDFPWVDPADRANYIGLLIAQILRPYLRTITPFGLISAASPSSGKTILSEGIGLLFGQRVRTWVRSENEQRKAITAVLDENAPTVVFDNIREGEIIDSPVLAMLITTPVWTDRLLGTNKTFTAANDRLWLATGNNVRLGGDMATRTVLVRLDPKTPHPELRTGFAIPDLDRWVKTPSNRTTLLRHLLILVMDWIANGAARTGHTMRQFSTWAAATGGFLAHHGIDGFLTNADAVHELDEQKSEWIGFLARWHNLYGSTPKLARDIRQSADVEFNNGTTYDRWQGDFITDGESNLPKNAVALSARLRGHVDRFYGDFVLRAKRDTDKNVTWWWVEQGGEEA
ncbi:hypothetical protein ABZ793_12085 [Micromonospora sp. NPDC047465]|uniref:hypothetical protein n=1 Tax=Micromonospora sp. NPDC047465 TaxID=3154813 RepID=UPI0033E0AAF7